MKIEGKTSSGFAFTVESALLEDFEFLGILADFTGGENLSRMRAILALPGRMLGDEGRKALLEHCRNEDGFCPTERVTAELGEILTICQKNNKAVKKF